MFISPAPVLYISFYDVHKKIEDFVTYFYSPFQTIYIYCGIFIENFAASVTALVLIDIIIIILLTQYCTTLLVLLKLYYAISAIYSTLNKDCYGNKDIPIIAIVSNTLLLWPIIILKSLAISQTIIGRGPETSWYNIAHSWVKIMSLSYVPSSTSTRTW